MKAGQGVIRLDEGFLRGVLGLVCVAENNPGGSEGHLLVPRHEPSVGAGIAPPCSLDEHVVRLSQRCIFDLLQWTALHRSTCHTPRARPGFRGTGQTFGLVRIDRAMRLRAGSTWSTVTSTRWLTRTT